MKHPIILLPIHIFGCAVGETTKSSRLKPTMRRAAILLLLGALGLSPGSTKAQFVQQGSKLVGTGAVGTAWQGQSVCISSDGNTAIMGGNQDNNFAGAAWVFTRSGGVWSQQGSKLVGSGAAADAHQGQAVALSADGNTAIVTGPNDNSNVGAAWVYTRSGGVWTQQGSKLVGTGATTGGTAGGAIQGTSVALSSDGNTAIVGGYADNSFVGAVWVYTRSGGVWTQQGNKLVGTGAVGASRQGQSVSLSSDGNTAIVGGVLDNNNTGAAWVYTRSGSVWTQQGSKLVGTGAVGAANQGQSVSLSLDGNTAIVGGPADNSSIGAVWVFTRSGGVWTQQGSKLVGTGAVGVARQGQSVSLSSDGNTAIASGFADNNNAGAAWVFTRSGGVWTQQGSKLVGNDAIGAAGQGRSVSISSDGNTVIESGIGDNTGAGAAWVFVNGQVGVDEEGDGIPTQFALEQNYPNPFNPTTVIVYEVPERSHVTLTVYDILGREVAKLVDETKSVGRHNALFNAMGLATGVYIYRVQSRSLDGNGGRDFVMTRKMAAIK
jgi:hypothetical protein